MPLPAIAHTIFIPIRESVLHEIHDTHLVYMYACATAPGWAPRDCLPFQEIVSESLLMNW